MLCHEILGSLNGCPNQVSLQHPHESLGKYRKDKDKFLLLIHKEPLCLLLLMHLPHHYVNHDLENIHFRLLEKFLPSQKLLLMP